MDAILAINAGSSSVKFGLFELVSTDLVRTAHGQIDGIGTAPRFRVMSPSKEILSERRWPDGAAQSHEALLSTLLAWVDGHLNGDQLIAVGHRVVHGGMRFTEPAPITPATLSEIEALAELAPLHQPHNLSPIWAIAAVRPDLPQVACFDTAFHRSMPDVARRFAIPRRFESAGVRRYGFHGLSYEYIVRELARIAPESRAGRTIVAHLGNGASLCAIAGGRSLDTTMGFTALDGLVMGTRCGSIDPGVLPYLQRRFGLSADALEELLYESSGLLGVSEISSDMKILLASGEPYAHEAVDLFVFRIAREVGALVSSLGGLDCIVFTAGIGEHAAEIREAVCRRLAWLGVRLDDDANRRGSGVISASSSAVAVRVIGTDEEAMIARHTLETLGRRQ